MKRPLDRVGSIKLKLGVVIVAAVLVTIAVLELGRWAGWPTVPAAIVAVAVALGMVQVLAHGMIFPLRQMARAATRLADGQGHEPVTASSRDEVGELARAFNRMADELAETDRVRRDLVANVSHELRTPVAAMRAVLENIADGVEQPDPATIGRVLRQTERLQGLVEALLDLSRLEAGVAHLEIAEVAASALLGEAVELVVTTDGPQVRSEVDPPALRFEADGRRLVQVLVNLLSNARRHAPADSTVHVAACAREGHVELSVTDAGPGISPADAERVFDRFHRSDDAVGSTERGGAGLGLAISRWIVDLHGGRIAVDPAYTAGCRMVVTLPYHEGA